MKAAPQKQTITIRDVEIVFLTLTIDGVTSLITHQFGASQKKSIEDKQQQKARTARGARDPQAEYNESMYWTSDGKQGFPASGIKKSCVDACSFVDGVTKVLARGSFFIVGEDILPINGSPRMREDIVRIGGKSADIRYRAEFPVPWSLTFDVRFNPTVISAEAITNLLNVAGFAVGIGDWRPQTNGSHGMFKVRLTQQ